ncbi:MAG TPA: glycosyltransferase family 4 protein [Candidatus Omnitrophota bacterium]|nr:glycosyltransferase family 4 protein [Candidatus Omnitrophota bacterium]
MDLRPNQKQSQITHLLILKPKLLVLYHFYFPDDVVSARHYEDLCEGLALLGWDVEVWPANRKYNGSSEKLKSKDSWHDVAIWRVWRPVLKQSGALGRIVNSAWMLTAWAVRWVFFMKSRPQVVLIGTDPILSLVEAIVMRWTSPAVKIVHWCFDLYPEAAVADRKIIKDGMLHKFLKWLMAKAYCACDSVVDLGICMKNLLQHYLPDTKNPATLTPWAFYEPDCVNQSNLLEREKLFGSAQLGILYSGNFGLAHSADLSFRLAKKLKGTMVQFCFSIRGPRVGDLKWQSEEQSIPVHFADFVSENYLNMRLEAADIHLVSLKPEWTGMVVPSKFFGAIAAGRPVLFEGSPESSIAKWITQFGLGWVLTEESYAKVADELVQISQNPNELKRLKQHCLDTYQAHFSRYKIISAWNELLTHLIA